MYNLYSQFFQGVGEMAEISLLWQNDLQQENNAGTNVGNEYLPYAFQHPRVCVGVAGLIQDNLYAQIGGKLMFLGITLCPQILRKPG